jgi:hypothetical protein
MVTSFVNFCHCQVKSQIFRKLTMYFDIFIFIIFGRKHQQYFVSFGRSFFLYGAFMVPEQDVGTLRCSDFYIF